MTINHMYTGKLFWHLQITRSIMTTEPVRVALLLASSPPLFLDTRTQRDTLTYIQKCEKEGLVHTAGVIMRMPVDFPRNWGSRNLS